MGLLGVDTSSEQVDLIAHEYCDAFWLKNEARFRKFDDLETSWPDIEVEFTQWWKSEEAWMIADFGDNSETDIDETLHLAFKKALSSLHDQTRHLFGISEVVHDRLNYLLQPLLFLKRITGITALTALLARKKSKADQNRFDNSILEESDVELWQQPEEPVDWDPYENWVAFEIWIPSQAQFHEDFDPERVSEPKDPEDEAR